MSKSDKARQNKAEKSKKERGAKASGKASAAEKSKQKKPTKKAGKQSLSLAEQADIYQLYEQSVQDPDSEVKLLDRIFLKLRGRAPMSLREDFCGSAYLCARWVSSHPKRSATGVDLDERVLESGRERHIESLTENQQDRVTLINADVRAESSARFDAVCAYNFSYWIFTDRASMLAYFKSVLSSLEADGIFALDAYGGTESISPIVEPRKTPAGFTYVWEQAEFNPIDHRAINYIHFRFKDGSELKRAFQYHWRFWTLPELQELLLEAGFAEVTIYWDVAEDGEDSDYRPRKVAENQPGWVCYLMARK